MAAQPAPSVAPQLDRSKAILFMGAGLIVANFLADNPGLKDALFGSEASLAQGLVSGGDTLPDLVVQGVGIAALYVVSRISDLAGTAAILFLAALWLLFLYRHAAAVQGYLLHVGSGGPSSNTSTTPGAGAGGTGKLQ